MPSDFPAYKIVATASLIPYARNSRTHSDAQVSKIAASIREFGFLNPIIVDGENGIIAGHGRVMAAQKLGLTELPVIEAQHLTEAQKRAYIIADNRLALDAGWDNDLLKIELQDLRGAGFNLELTGFNLSEIAGFLTNGGGKTDPDAVPDVPAAPVSVLGDVWVMGRHRLMCGDSTSATDVAKLMNGQSADLCFTSPPYAQQRDYGAAKEQVGDWDGLMAGVFDVLPVKDGAQVLVNLGLVHQKGEWMPYWERWVAWMRDAGWRRFGWYVWDQGPGLPGEWNGRLAPSHEFIFHFNRESRRPHKTVESKHGGQIIGGGGLRGKDGVVHQKTGAGKVSNTHRIPDSVFRVMRHKGKVQGGSHPAVFPVALVEEVFAAYSKSDDVVFEPFCGSGTQIIAAEKMAIHCFGMELDPAYCDVGVRRWQEFTGLPATLETDGRSFADVAAERVKAAA